MLRCTKQNRACRFSWQPVGPASCPPHGRSIDCAPCSRPACRSFEDHGERAASADRLAALRAELKRRGLDGFIVPRADRHQNEYVPPLRGAARLAHRLHRLGRRRDRARRPRRDLRRRPLRAAGARPDRHRAVRASSTWSTTRPTNGWRPICPAGARFGYDPWLHTAEGAEKLAKACDRRGRDAGAGRAEPDRLGLGRPPCPAARRAWWCTT